MMRCCRREREQVLGYNREQERLAGVCRWLSAAEKRQKGARMKWRGYVIGNGSCFNGHVEWCCGSSHI